MKTYLRNPSIVLGILFIILIAFADIAQGTAPVFLITIGIANCVAAFLLGAWKYKQNNLRTAYLLVASILLLALTIKNRNYFSVILILSYLLWNLLAPVLLRFKRILSITGAVAFLCVYGGSLTKIQIPFYPIAFFPAFLAGRLMRSADVERSKTELKKIIFNLCVSVAGFIGVLYKGRKFSLMTHLLFTKLGGDGAQAAMYLPFLLLFLLWFGVNLGILLFYVFPSMKGAPEDVKESAESVSFAKKDTWNFVWFILVSGVFLLIFEVMLRNDILHAIVALLQPQGFFNVLILASLFLLLASLIGKGLSTAVLSIFSLLLAVANFIKLKYFDEPFYPWDIGLTRDAILIAKHYLTAGIVLAVACAIAAVVFLLVKYRKKVGKMLRLRPVLLMIPFAIALLSINAFALQNPDTLEELKIEKSWYIGKDEMISNGFIVQNYYYLTDLDQYIPSAPDGYSKAEIQELCNSLATNSMPTENGTKPNIIVVMDESFWDPTELEGVTFDKDITKTANTYKIGNMVSPVFGARTANTEFEALTGLSTYFMSPGLIPYNLYLRRTTPSLVSALSDAGYDTTAIHPNTGAFYNRNTVYKNMGFDRFIDIEGFDVDEEAAGYQVSDSEVVDKILSITNEKSDQPKFIFALTIENHDPYYNKNSNLSVHATSDKLDGIETSVLSNYAQGVYDADQALKKLIDAVNESDTPTNLYFFGDHLPRLGSPYDIYDVYNKLGFFEDPNTIYMNPKLYTTLFVAWSNYQKIEPLSSAISPSQIAYQVLKDSHISYPSYFSILEKLRVAHPVLHSILSQSDNANDDFIEKYRTIQYDILYGKRYLANSSVKK